jgi:tetrapyrrole methylase family protein/MazG family protein
MKHSGVRLWWTPEIATGTEPGMTEFDELIEIMQALRGPEGCPWDREQTHESLKPYLLEESYEALEAVDSGDPQKLCAELGDVLLQVVFHAQVGAEAGRFDIHDVCERINRKLRYRHPHVFGDVTVSGSDEVITNWEQLKRLEAETGKRESALDGIPHAMPALMRAQELQKKAARVGFDWEDVEGPLAKVEEELGELNMAREAELPAEITHEVGDLLFAVVNVARFLGVDAEDALRQSCQRFSGRFRQVEAAAKEAGRDLHGMELAEMDELWEAAKKAERGAS